MKRLSLIICFFAASAVAIAGCNSSAEESGGASEAGSMNVAGTASGTASATPEAPSPPSATAEVPSLSESPGMTQEAPVSTSEFNPICGKVASQQKYVVGEWEGFFRDETKGNGDRIVFTEDCQVMQDENIDYNAPDGEWSQRGGNVRFVLVMNLDDKAPNLYKGSLNAEGTTLTGRSRNGVFQFTRVVAGGMSETAAADAPEGDAVAVAADYAKQWETLVPADSRALVCEVYRDQATVQDTIAASSVAEIEARGTLSVGSRKQYETAAIDYFRRTC